MSQTGEATFARGARQHVSRRCDEIGRSAHRTFLVCVSVAFCGFLVWSSTVRLDAVTRSTGTVVPVTQNQILQHLEGGIVSEILVHEGDAVAQDQPLLRIRDTQSLATFQQTLTQLAAKRATLARLDAELAGLKSVTFPADLEETSILANERDLFAQRRRDQGEQILILEDKIRQQEIALAGLKARQINLLRERGFASQRTDSLQRLSGLGAVSRNDLLQAMSTLQQLDTKISDLEHDIPQTESALSEATRQRNSGLLKFRSDISEEKSKILVEIQQLTEAAAGLRDRAFRTEVRAPISGKVNKLLVTTVGGVIAPGAPIMEIVPLSSIIAIEAQLSPQDRAEIWPGTKAIVKITAYDYSVYGGLEAEVVDISPDVLKDKDGRPYFRIRLNASNELGEKHPVVPGMMANVDMITRQHTILQYLVSPIMNIRDMALRR